MRYAAVVKFLLFSALLLLPVFTLAQQDQPLPDAPSAVAAAARSTYAPADFPSSAFVQNASDLAINPAQPDLESIPQGDAFRSGPWSPESPVGSSYETAATAPGIRIDLDSLFASMNRPASGGVTGPGQVQMPERYHWKGLLWESFAFFGVENAYRLMTDPYFRHLTADGPFWHNYISSLKQWNWRRWDDGDDFLVAYIAHPMQGSVTEYIEIQNDPRARDLRIDDGKPYWKSQFRAFLWSTAFSFDQKLGPLGEAALGNEGGYTYIVNCPYPCTSYVPGVSKVTNNTGDVKLVSTPVVGEVWTLVEDGIDRWISDRLQERYGDLVFVKIIRGSLNPCRTMANTLRWRKPWYRDYQHDTINLKITRVPHFLPGDDAVILKSPRYELFPHYNAIWLPVNTASCFRCRQLTTGSGLGFAMRLATYADLDFDVNYQPNASAAPSDRAGGNIVSGTFGFRSGYQNSHFALKASVRPGFLSYDAAYEATPSSSNPTPPVGRITHFTTALAVNADYNVNRHLALRVAGGNTAVRYREPYNKAGIGTYPYLNWLAKWTFLTNENWTYQTGAVLRF